MVQIKFTLYFLKTEINYFGVTKVAISSVNPDYPSEKYNQLHKPFKMLRYKKGKKNIRSSLVWENYHTPV